MVTMLQTLDGGGNISYYYGSVTIDRNPHFFGPGLSLYKIWLIDFSPSVDHNNYGAWYLI